MRKVAIIKNHPHIRQVILHQGDNGVHIFPCTSLNDGFAEGDEWYEDLETAESICQSEYGVTDEDWKFISDPLEYCQHDWIEPVRIVGISLGKPQWGRLEKLIDGAWQEIELTEGRWIWKMQPSSTE